jgi:iron(III) transport system substrate-binding protein
MFNFTHVKKSLVILGIGTVSLLGVSVPAQAKTVVPLVLYSAQGYDQAVATAFTKATGIPIKLTDDSTGPLLAKVQAEKNNPQWGALWVDGNTAFAALDKQGQLATYTPKAELNTIGKSLLPKDNSYVPTGTTTMAAFIYNSSTMMNPPKSYQDLLKPEYKGLIGMNDPSQSGPTFPFIAGLFNQLGGQTNGVSKGEAFFSALKANGLHVYPTNGDTKHALEVGEIQGGLIQSSAAQGEVLKFISTPQAGFTPKIVYLPNSTLLPSVIGIDKKAPAAVQAEAKQLIEYILSPAGQAVMQTGDPAGDSLFWPVVPGVKALSGLGAFPAAYQVIDPYFWGPQQSAINTWFDSNIK